MDVLDGLEKLSAFVQQVRPLNADTLESFKSIWQPYACKRKVVLTAAGDTENYLYFVLEGVQRAFYLSDDDKEATLVFTYPPSFSGVADSFLLQQPSKYSLETLTASSFLRTTYQQVNRLMEERHDFESVIRKALAITLSGVLERQIELQCFTAEQKFRALLKRSPHILHLVPQKYLASYIGIDATNFSKLLGSVRI